MLSVLIPLRDVIAPLGESVLKIDFVFLITEKHSSTSVNMFPVNKCNKINKIIL